MKKNMSHKIFIREVGSIEGILFNNLLIFFNISLIFSVRHLRHYFRFSLILLP